MGLIKKSSYLLLILIIFLAEKSFTSAGKTNENRINFNNLEEKIRNSYEYINFSNTCSEINRKTWKTKSGKQPSDLCSLNTFTIAAKVFDIDFPFFNCIINQESGAKDNVVHYQRYLFTGDPDLLNTKAIKPMAANGTGNGYGQLVQETYSEVWNYLKNHKDKNNPYFASASEELNKKFQLFFNLTGFDNPIIPNPNNVNLKKLHPLINLAFSLATLTYIKPYELKMSSNKSNPNLAKKFKYETPRYLFDNGRLPPHLASKSFEYYPSHEIEDMNRKKEYQSNVDPNSAKVLPRLKPNVPPEFYGSHLDKFELKTPYFQRLEIIEILAAAYNGTGNRRYVNDITNCVRNTEGIYRSNVNAMRLLNSTNFSVVDTKTNASDPQDSNSHYEVADK